MAEQQAVTKGPAARITSTLATVVRVMASMKKVNMPHQHTTESQNVVPPRRMAAKALHPRCATKMAINDKNAKKLRQKVTSKDRANSRYRVTIPAVDHSRVTSSMVKTARLWLSAISHYAEFKKVI